MNRRWALGAAVVVIAGSAVGLAFALRSSASPAAPRPLGAPIYVRKLSVSVPRGFHNYRLRFDVYNPGPVGHVLTNFGLPPRHPRGWDSTIEWVLSRWAAAESKWIALKKHNYGPPSNEVALELAPLSPQECPHLACPPVRLHLPLSPNQPWNQERIASGAPSYRDGYLRFHHMLYYVMYWIGPDAPANDRAAVLAALHSIRPIRY